MNQLGLVGAEIGVFQGGNAIDMLKTLKIKTLHLVDHYKAYYASEAEVQVHQEKQDENNKRAHDDLVEYGDKIVWHVKSSVEAAPEVEDESLDFVYIDAEHSYDSLMSDLVAWYPKVRKGGLVSGHDWNYKFLQNAVNEFAEKRHHVVENDGDWWFKKI